MQETIAIELTSLNQTRELGNIIGELAQPGDVIALYGDLGAGKTTLTQAIGKGLGVPDNCYITSPTFSLLHEYPGRIPLYHMDLYRLASIEELEYLGFDDFIYGQGVTVIEWPDKFASLLPEEGYLGVYLSFNASGRQARIIATGAKWSKRFPMLQQQKSSNYTENLKE